MEANVLAQGLDGKSLETRSALEWRQLLLEIIKQNNHASLISLLQQLPDALKNICVSPIDGSNLLEFAILNSSWTCAHVIVDFECGAAQLTPNKANEASWAKVIYRIVKLYKKEREIRSLQNKKYQPILKERMKAYVEAYNNGCVSLFAAVNYPSLFILLTQLGADIRKKNHEHKTVITVLLESKEIVANTKRQLLQYILRNARDLLLTSSGPEGIPPVFYFYQNNGRRFIKQTKPKLGDIIGIRTKSGKTLADLISVRDISGLLPKKKLLKFFLHNDNLSRVVQRAEKLHMSLQFPEVAQALEILVAENRPIADVLKIPSNTFLCAYLKELGAENLHLGDLESFYGKQQKKVATAKKQAEHRIANANKKNNIGQFPIDQLPMDILALFAAYLSLQEVMALFSLSKAMREKYSTHSSPLLWKNVAQNTFNELKFSAYNQSGANDWKNLVHSNSRMATNWITGKCTKRDLITDRVAWHMTLSEHWACWNVSGGVQFWNCDTDEQPPLIQCPTFMNACFVESSASRDPIVAAHILGSQSMVNIMSQTNVMGSILLPQASTSYKISSLDKNHVVTGDNLVLIDIQQQKVLNSLPAKTASILSVNKFLPSPTIVTFSRDKRVIQTFDRDLKLVQGHPIPWYHHFGSISVIDEHRYLLTKNDGFIALDNRYTKESDIYNLAVTFPKRNFIGVWATPVNHAVDVLNNRFLMDAWKYGLTMIWDLKTLTWSAVRRNNTDVPRANHIAINSRYEVILDVQGHVRVHDYS